MNINDNKENKFKEPYEITKIKTESGSYSFTQSWVENEALKDILVGLVADDLNRQIQDPNKLYY